MKLEKSAESIYQYKPRGCAPNFNLLPYYHEQLLSKEAIARLSLLKNPELAFKWQEFKNGLPMSESIAIKFPSIRDLHFQNNCIHYLKPEVISFHKQMKPGPWLDHNKIQLPIPANVQHRYRRK